MKAEMFQELAAQEAAIQEASMGLRMKAEMFLLMPAHESVKQLASMGLRMKAEMFRDLIYFATTNGITLQWGSA